MFKCLCAFTAQELKSFLVPTGCALCKFKCNGQQFVLSIS